MDRAKTLLLSTAYAPPVQYLCKLYAAGGRFCLEGCESFIKQSYRSRTLICGAHGVEMLSLPIEQGAGHSCAIRDVRLSSHSDWARVHTEALRTAYGTSPFFEYYWDDIEPIYRRGYTFLWDFNCDLLQILAEAMDLPCTPTITVDFLPPSTVEVALVADWRYGLRPKQPFPDPSFVPVPYYQPWRSRLGFVPNLSAFDLLFNMGPESILVLRDSIKAL